MRRTFHWTAATCISVLALTALQAQTATATSESLKKPRADWTFIAGETYTMELCWRASVGQTVVLSYQAGKSWVPLSRTRLQTVAGGCKRGYPLIARFTFAAPTTPQSYVFREELLRKGKAPGARGLAINVLVRQAQSWSAEQQVCVDAIFLGSPERDRVTEQGPERVPASALSQVNACVERSRTLTLDYVSAWRNAYGLPATTLPTAHQDLIAGRVTVTTFIDQIVGAAREKYAGVSYAITRERSTATVLNAYASMVESALETNISDPLTDPLLAPWLTSALPASLRDAERALRQDERWQYTRRAYLEYAILGEELLCGFGFSCDRAAIARMRDQLAAMPAMVPRWPLF